MQEISKIIKTTSPVLGPAMLWAAWKGGDDSGDVLTALISLGGKPNQVSNLHPIIYHRS